MEEQPESVAAEVKIRRLVAADLAHILKIAEQSDLSYWSAGDYSLELEKDDSITLGAEFDQTLIGFLIARPIISEKAVELYNIAVDEIYRNRGIGKSLIRQLSNIAKTKKSGKIFIEVRSLNEGAIKFYEKLGFYTIGIRKNFYTSPKDDALLMKLDF